jgi:hypothetical protein
MTKSASKSKKTGRGGSRPGAGRPPKFDPLLEMLVEALDAVEAALKARDPDNFYTAEQHRMHMAMLMFGVRPEITAAALFKPGVSEKFRHEIKCAIRSVERSEA